MKIDKKYKGIIDEGWRYKIEGDIETDESLVIALDKGLYVTGSIKAGESIKAGRFIQTDRYIQAGEFIKAGGFIEAGDFTEAGEFIQAGWYIQAGESIKAGWFIQAGEFIKAGESIKAGENYGISAGLSITCKGTLSFGLKAFAGICTWREILDREKTITCSKMTGGGVVEYGILKETGEPKELNRN